MRFILIAIFIFSVFHLSCSNRNVQVPNVSIADSLVKEYLLEIDSLPYYDTTDINYQVLKAYQNNDTVFLKNFTLKKREAKKSERRWSFLDSCIHETKLQDLQVDEAYRLIFHPAFCSTPISTTITRKGDSANLHFLLYQIAHDTIPCGIISEYDRILSKEEWEAFQLKLWEGDIWGLKRSNGIFGLDGSTLVFVGYENGKRWNRPDKIIYGSRWSGSSLNEAFRYVLMLSGNRKGCYWIVEK